MRRFFQKATGVRGNAPQNGLFGSFWASLLKKNGNGFLTQHPKKKELPKVTPFVFYVEKILSVLFLGYVAARKRTKKNGVIRGAAPNPATFFEKRSIKNFHPVEVDRLGGGGRKLSSCESGYKRCAYGYSIPNKYPGVTCRILHSATIS